MNNPFTPRCGQSPLVLAGRDDEIGTFERTLRSLEFGPARKDLCLIGPRGNGKTVLLNEVAKMCEGRSRVVTLDAEATSSPRQFAATFAREFKGRESQWKLKSLKGNVAGVVQFQIENAAVPANNEPDNVSPVVETLQRTFENGLADTPLTLCIAEAHEANPKVIKGLFSAAQRFSSRQKAPFLLVVAGTPNLEDRMRGVGVTFSERTRTLRIGRIAPQAARTAFQDTFGSVGMDMAPFALTKAVDVTHAYPYFVQLLGEALFDAAEDSGSSVIGEHEWTVGHDAFDVQKAHFYANRTRELERRGLIDAAVALAPKLKSLSRTLSSGNVIEQMAASGVEGPEAASEGLHEVGYLWRQDGLRSGLAIPSLATYIRKARPDIVKRQRAVRKTGDAGGR